MNVAEARKWIAETASLRLDLAVLEKILDLTHREELYATTYQGPCEVDGQEFVRLRSEMQEAGEFALYMELIIQDRHVGDGIYLCALTGLGRDCLRALRAPGWWYR